MDPSRSTTRTTAATLTVLGAVLALAVLAAYVSTFGRGGLGFSYEPGEGPFTIRLSVSPHGDAAAAGLASGDVIDVRNLNAPDRFALLWSRTAGTGIDLSVERGPLTRRVHVIAQRESFNWEALFIRASAVWLVFGAFVLAWRARNDSVATYLSAFLSISGFSALLFSNNACTPWPALTMILSATVGAWDLGIPALLMAALLLGRLRIPAAARNAIAWPYGLLCLAGVVAGSLPALATWFAFTDPLRDPWLPVARGIFAFVELGVVVLFAVAIVRTRGRERSQLSWLALAVVPYIASAVVLGIQYSWIAQQVVNYAWVWMPIGITYAVLSRQLLDIGFVINRVAVYSGVSFVIVAAFVLTEYLLTEVFGLSRDENAVLGAVVALGLGLSMRFIHHFVDRGVDALFFRKRHEDDRTLREFAHEATFISDPSLVLERATAILERHANASCVVFAISDGSGRYGSVDENDPAIVTLRAWHKPVDLRSRDSKLEGDVAYPMFARGRLVGALALGPKRSGEAYAPDESSAIAELAHGVGLALDGLVARASDRAELILAIREALREAAVTERGTLNS